MKKFFSILLAVMMLMTIAAPVFAAAETGSITLKNISIESDNTLTDGYRYDIYKLLDLSYSKVNGTEAYSYTVNADWVDFFKDNGSADPDALDYVSIDADGYVKWNTTDDDDTVAAFAKMALKYAQDNGITPTASSDDLQTNPDIMIDSSNSTLVFNNLELGYYLIDSNVGVLCGLTTTNPNAEVTVKNAAPTLDKRVKEDDVTDRDYWSDHNSSGIGEEVQFRVAINVHAGAQEYILHDHLSDGFTFKEVTRVEHIPFSGTTHDLDPAQYSTTVPSSCASTGLDCTFEVHFDDAIFDKLETNDKLVVYYTAILNTSADVTTAGNPNTAYVEYGEGHFTAPVSTTTYTFAFDLLKVNEQNTKIDGAAFKLYDSATGGNEIFLMKISDDLYRVATTDEISGAAYAIKVYAKDGKVRIEGLDNGNYYLEEVETPEGYNTLSSRQKVTISEGNLEENAGTAVTVINKTGSVLPSTGSTGTALFIILGGMLALGAGVVLFARQRMSKIAE